MTANMAMHLESGLLTDLYQLTMLQGYLERDMHDVAVFEFFVRKLPEHRAFLMAAGLEQVLSYLEDLRFPPDEVDWLRSTGRFDPDLADYLAEFRFHGDVEAMAEGTLFFPDEPILRVTAPLPEAQLVETRVINLLQLESVIASKAARSVLAAPERILVDFGLRRAHGAEAGLLAARAAYIAGFSGSSTVLAGKEFGIPMYGTVAHSFIEAHDDEVDAFESFARAQPANTVLVIDTYDTVAAAQKIVELAPRLEREGIPIRGVRLDSGDLASLAEEVRRVLDRGGLGDVRIFASGGLDEHELARLADAGAPIDGFGVGTRFITSSDAPYLDCAYKLQEYAGVPRRKRSDEKATWPGRKQVYRRFDDSGHFAGDVLTLMDEHAPGEPLLRPVMRGGQRLSPPEPLERMRERAAAELRRLPGRLRGLDGAPPYPVEIAPALRDLAAEVDARSAP